MPQVHLHPAPILFLERRQLKRTVSPGKPSPEVPVGRRAVGMAACAGGILLILLGYAYTQLQLFLFAAVSLSGIWLGIASLFSP
jgi:hypothetical protein